MLSIYSILISNDNSIINAQNEILDDLLSFIIQCTFRSDILEDDNESNNMLDYFMLGDISQCETAQCNFTSNYSEILYWSKAYTGRIYGQGRRIN